MIRNTIAIPCLPILSALFFLPATALASSDAAPVPELTGATVGFMSIAVFVIAYLAVMAEEFTHLHKVVAA